MVSYKESGVDIDAGNEAVERIKKYAEATFKFAPGKIIGGIGGFSGLIEHEDGSVTAYATDGVGTKLLIAIYFGKHEGVGQDLVAMCVNDIACSGVRPRIFLDYMAMDKQIPERTEVVVGGIAKACEYAGVALIGGEMAEMPGMYKPGYYDLAGFAVGFAEHRIRIIDGRYIQPRMAVWGLPSSGIHSNGFSLVRKIFDIDRNWLTLHRKFDELDGHMLGEELIVPTCIYVPDVERLLKKHRVAGLAHITGGGLTENVRRILPNDCTVIINTSAWQWPPIFGLIQTKGSVETEEMHRTFNCGVGLVAISHEDLSDEGFINIGEVITGEKEVRFV